MWNYRKESQNRITWSYLQNCSWLSLSLTTMKPWSSVGRDFDEEGSPLEVAGFRHQSHARFFLKAALLNWEKHLSEQNDLDLSPSEVIVNCLEPLLSRHHSHFRNSGSGGV